ncbi:MAG: hypothetical protein ABI282_07030 [Candidatus Baltobacteraceae bacterium]
MLTRFAAASLCAMLLAACSGAPQAPTTLPSLSTTLAENNAAKAPLLYTYSTAGSGLIAGYLADQGGKVVAQSILAGTKTRLAGGAGYFFGGGVEFASDGTLYVFDALKGKLLTFAPAKDGSVAHGNVAPLRTELLPSNADSRLEIAPYAGFAQDTKGHFWTVDKTNGKLVEFPMAGNGTVQPLASVQPKFASPKGIGEGTAQTVADDGKGNIFCSCESHTLSFESFGITQYAATGSKLVFVSSFYGIAGSLDGQLPPEVLHVDAVTQTIYLGLFRPNAVIAFPVSTPTGHAPPPRIIGGPNSMLAGNVASISTDSIGRIYVADNSTVAEFPRNASGDVTPIRVLSDPTNMQYVQSTSGEMLAFH